jgi:hypothetical protein
LGCGLNSENYSSGCWVGSPAGDVPGGPDVVFK